jgi:hypothetical protein
MIVGNRRHGLHDGMARAELLGLQCPLEIGLIGERRTHSLSAVAMDNVDVGRSKRARSPNHVVQQRPTGKGLQHFWQRRVHALALPRGENDDGNRH